MAIRDRMLMYDEMVITHLSNGFDDRKKPFLSVYEEQVLRLIAKKNYILSYVQSKYCTESYIKTNIDIWDLYKKEPWKLANVGGMDKIFPSLATEEGREKYGRNYGYDEESLEEIDTSVILHGRYKKKENRLVMEGEGDRLIKNFKNSTLMNLGFFTPRKPYTAFAACKSYNKFSYPVFLKACKSLVRRSIPSDDINPRNGITYRVNNITDDQRKSIVGKRGEETLFLADLMMSNRIQYFMAMSVNAEVADDNEIFESFIDKLFYQIELRYKWVGADHVPTFTFSRDEVVNHEISKAPRIWSNTGEKINCVDEAIYEPGVRGGKIGIRYPGQKGETPSSYERSIVYEKVKEDIDVEFSNILATAAQESVVNFYRFVKSLKDYEFVKIFGLDYYRRDLLKIIEPMAKSIIDKSRKVETQGEIINEF